MKPIHFLLLFFALFFWACENENLPDTFPFGLENDFKINDVYHSNDNDLKFKITEINDSRCPSDVICVWAGKADVRIEMESPEFHNFFLSTLHSEQYPSTDTVGNYSFQLLNVLPYPVSTRQTKLEEYIVTLKIEKL